MDVHRIVVIGCWLVLALGSGTLGCTDSPPSATDPIEVDVDAPMNLDADKVTPISDATGPEIAVPQPVDAIESRPPQLPANFPVGLPKSDLLGAPLGFQVARTIIHLHTVYSHDACDGQPFLQNDEPNEPCLDSFRQAICTDHIDAAMLTEHYDRMATIDDFRKLFLHRPGDQFVIEEGIEHANAVQCADGTRSLIMPGMEGDDDLFSPIGLTDHPIDGPPEVVEAAYKDGSAEGLARLRGKHGLITALHIESAPPGHIMGLDLDAVEIGNLHVLMHPEYRETIGLEPDSPVITISEWLAPIAPLPPADLVFLEFHERLGVYNNWWDQLLSDRMVTGFAGNDAHQNALPLPMQDGERADSYRRMMKWYGNHALVTEKSPTQIKDAIANGRLYMVFEVLGSPVGFDFRAERGGTTYVMGDTVDGPARLRCSAPAALIGDVSVPTKPTIRLYRIDEIGTELVTETTGDLDIEVAKPGRYRIELFVTPTYLETYLSGFDHLLRDYPWIYSNPIMVAGP